MIQVFWLHFWGAVMLSIFIYSLQSIPLQILSITSIPWSLVFFLHSLCSPFAPIALILSSTADLMLFFVHLPLSAHSFFIPPYLHQVSCSTFNLALFSFFLPCCTHPTSVLLTPLIILLSSPMGYGPNQKEGRSKPHVALRGHQDQRVDTQYMHTLIHIDTHKLD